VQGKKHSNVIAAFDFCRRPPVILVEDAPGMCVMRETEAARIVCSQPLDSAAWCCLGRVNVWLDDVWLWRCWQLNLLGPLKHGISTLHPARIEQDCWWVVLQVRTHMLYRPRSLLSPSHPPAITTHPSDNWSCSRFEMRCVRMCSFCHEATIFVVTSPHVSAF
jgi:hypothetical protein